jgi:hypothetical protein
MGYIYYLYAEHPEMFIALLDKNKYFIFDEERDERENNAEFIRLIQFSEQCWERQERSDGTYSIHSFGHIQRLKHVIYVMRRRTDLSDEFIEERLREEPIWVSSSLVIFREELVKRTQHYAHRTVFPTGSVQVLLDDVKFAPGRTYGKFRIVRKKDETDESLIRRLDHPTF